MDARRRPIRSRPVQLGTSIAAVLLGLAALVACGGGDGEAGGDNGEVVITAGAGTASPVGAPGGDTAIPPPDDTAGQDEQGATTAEPSPPTAGEGEAGIRTGPGGTQVLVVPACGAIDVTAHLEQGAYADLRARLTCIFENEAVAPADVVAAARAADAIAASRLAGQDPSAVEEAQQIAEDVAGDQEGG